MSQGHWYSFPDKMSNVEELKQIYEASFSQKNFAPDARGTIQNRQYGIDSKEIAQEFRDNSADAQSTSCEIYLIPHSRDDSTINKFACLDDGCGMDFEKLTDAIILSKHHDHQDVDDGKFGEGINNGVIGMGDDITIVSKKKGCPAVGIYMDLPDMMDQETFKPTSAGLAESYKDRIPKEIWQKFSKQESGTLISIKSIHDTHLANVKNIAKDLRTAFEFTNAEDKGMNVHIKTSYGEKSEAIKPLDVFYRKNPSSLEYVAETTLKINRLPNGKYEVYEELIGSRYRGAHRRQDKEITGTAERPSLWKFSGEAPKGRGRKPYDDEFHFSVNRLPESGTWFTVPVRIIKVTEEAYKAEGEIEAFKNVQNRRRGLWFYRNNRLVKPASHLGLSLDDHYNRTRLEVRFPPGLDAAMGLRTQKQMGNEIPNEAIHNALIVLFKQLAAKLCTKPVRDDDGASVVTEDGSESTTTTTTTRATGAGEERRTIPLPIQVKKANEKQKEKAASPVETIQEEKKEEEDNDGEVVYEEEEDFNGNTLVTPVRPTTPPVSAKPRPAYVLNDIGFDIATQNVILTDMEDGREIARFNCYGIGASIRDRLRVYCEKMGRIVFLSYIAKEVALQQQYNI